MMDVLEHLEPQELFDTLEQIKRILNPGGSFIIHVPNAEGLFGMRIRYGDYTHTQAFTPKSIKQVLLINGFANIRCFEDKPIVHGIMSLIRSFIWAIGTAWPRLLLMAETGERGCVLSQNMTVVTNCKA